MQMVHRACLASQWPISGAVIIMREASLEVPRAHQHPSRTLRRRSQRPRENLTLLSKAFIGGVPLPCQENARHYLTGNAMYPPWPAGMQEAMFGMGCFWCAAPKLLRSCCSCTLHLSHLRFFQAALSSQVPRTSS